MNGGGVDATARGSWRTGLGFVGLTCIVGALVFVHLVVLHQPAESDMFFRVYGVVATAAYLIPGVVLLLRRRWHVVGWLLCLFAVSMAFNVSSDWVGARSGDAWLVWLVDMYNGSLGWLPMVALLVVFPDGLAAQTRRQRRTGRVVLTAAVAATVTEALVAQVSRANNVLLPSPLPFGFVSRTVKDNVTISVVFAALIVAFVGMVLRYRSSQAAARRQYRWVLSAIVFLVAALAFGLSGSTLSGDENGPWWLPILFAYVSVPIAFMVAILRYRLYEIDRLVSRTITYSAVVAVLGGVYALAVGVFTEVSPFDSDVAIAASTLTVAALFNPLRRRMQSGVERRFNRTRFDAVSEVDAFARRLRNQTDLLVVELELRAVVDRTLRPHTVRLWVRDHPQGRSELEAAAH